MISDAGLLKDKTGGRVWHLCHAHRLMRLIACLLIMLMTVQVYASEIKQYTINDVPNVRLQDARLYVSDPTQILSAGARDSINAVLGRLEQSTGIEAAVVMLPSIGEDDIFDFAHELFRKWGIGKKKSDNGFLILFVMDQRKVRFTTGYGIEGTMTDAMSKRIQMQQMVPRFKQGDWDGGMVAGVRMSAKVLDGSMQPENDSEGDDFVYGIIILLVIVGFFVFFIYVMGSQQRCPKCNKRSALKKLNVEHLFVKTGSRGHTKHIRRTTYICKYCGHVVTKDENIDDSGNALTNAFILGSMLSGGRGGGGGSFGGSFGGGSTGGGGSTSEW